MRLVHTAELSPNSPLSPDENHQVYCGLDSAVTLEIWQALEPKLSADPLAAQVYAFERALQGPYLEIMQRGFLVNEPARRKAAEALRERVRVLQDSLNYLAIGVWGRGLNPNSPAQMKDFLYSRRGLGLPEQWISKKGVKKLSTDREALEKLDLYLHARPFVAIVLLMRDLLKQLSVFECEIDADGRFRAGYNIAGTETGRPSSSTNAFGTASNAQNIAPGLRYVFCSDPGKKMAVIDLEQVEARDVGFFCGCLFGDWKFLDACESGDLHSNNAKLVWPELEWTGDPARDRKIAERIFYREFSYRDMAKRGGHLSNYYGTAWTAGRSLKVPVKVMDEFQARYIRGGTDQYGRPITPAYPSIARWWQWTGQQLQTVGHLTTPFGRRRHFFGRVGDDATLREAIAFLPQSTTADRMNLGLWRVWRHEPRVQLLAQTYDSISFQYDESADEEDILLSVLALIRVELVAGNGRSYVVPGEAKIGWNWGAASPANPEGLVKWKPGWKDGRVRGVGRGRIAL